MNNLIEYVDMKSKIDIEYYYDDNKQVGFDTIKDNDMLQYHYFAQEYAVVSCASLICVVTMTHNNIKTYIGFMSLSSPTLDKKYRNLFFGRQFLKKMFLLKADKSRPDYELTKNVHFFNIARMVLIPSFRGLGFAKFIQDKMLDEIFNNPNNITLFDDIAYVELSSAMLHTFDFSSDKMNKSFIDIKNVLTDEEYSEFFKSAGEQIAKGMKGYHGPAKIVATTVFRYNTSKKYLNLIKDYCIRFYNVILSDAQLEKLTNNVDPNFFKGADFEKCLEDGIPTMLYNVLDASEVPNIEIVKLNKKDLDAVNLENF